MVKVGWKQKAAIARACARIPFGDPLYKFGQKRFGQLKPNPTSRLSKQVEMARWLTKHGAGIGGKSFFEVGTGHIPIVPLGFYLAGATQTWTVDLNRRLDWGLVGETLHWIASNKTAVTALYRDEIVAADVFEQRFTALMETSGDARACLAKAGIRYLAPIDAASTKLAAESVDCHYSVTVLEHIPVDGLRGILVEARRLLKPDGYALHFVDLSDHFQHQDRSISRINFLRFSNEEWRHLAGNRFAYCSRLRSSDLLKLMSDAGFHVAHVEQVVDEQAKALVEAGFPIDEAFSKYDVVDLCTTSLRVLLRK